MLKVKKEGVILEPTKLKFENKAAITIANTQPVIFDAHLYFCSKKILIAATPVIIVHNAIELSGLINTAIIL